MRVRWTWPVAAVRGRASTTARRRGCLKEARRPSQKVRERLEVGAGEPSSTTTTATTTSPHCGSGTPTTAISPTVGVLAQHVFDLGRRERFPASADEVARPAHDRQVAVVVEGPDTAGVVPAVAERFGRCVRVVEVAVHEERAAHHDFTAAPMRTSTPGCATPTLPGLRKRSASPSWTPGPASVDP